MEDIAIRLRSWVKNESQESDPAAVILQAADEIERLRSSRRWIPASERLPDLEESVMVGNAKDGWVCIGSRQLTGEYHHWDGDDFEELNEPTHWMPLPEPPEVK